jgi:hypothetical protein
MPGQRAVDSMLIAAEVVRCGQKLRYPRRAMESSGWESQ